MAPSTWRPAPAQHAAHAASAQARHRRPRSASSTHPAHHALLPALPAIAGAATTFARRSANRARAWTAARRSCISSIRRVGGSHKPSVAASARAAVAVPAPFASRWRTRAIARAKRGAHPPRPVLEPRHSCMASATARLTSYSWRGCCEGASFTGVHARVGQEHETRGTRARRRDGGGCSRRPSTRRDAHVDTHGHDEGQPRLCACARLRLRTTKRNSGTGAAFRCRAASAAAEMRSRTSTRVPGFLQAAGACPAERAGLLLRTLLVVAFQPRPRVRPRWGVHVAEGADVGHIKRPCWCSHRRWAVQRRPTKKRLGAQKDRPERADALRGLPRVTSPWPTPCSC